MKLEEDTFKALAGGSTTIVAFVTGIQPELESWFRVTALVVSITVGVLTAITLAPKAWNVVRGAWRWWRE